MRTCIVASLFLATAVLAFGQAKKADNSSVEQIVTQLERDWGSVGLSKANMEKDLKTLDRILADDWVGSDFQGNTVNKAQSIANLKSGAATSQSFDLGPMKVRVFGNTAIVNGSDTEKSTYKGKDSSGKYVWTDVFVNRDGKWQAVSSQSTKLAN